MKVIGINGSARKDGNTSLLIKAVFAELEAEGIETDLVQLHGKALEPCKACFGCGGKRQCVVKTDYFNECFAKMVEADGIVLGSPVYSADVTAGMKAFLERALRENWFDLRGLSRKSGGAWSDDLPAVDAVHIQADYLPTIAGEAALSHLVGAAYQMFVMHGAPLSAFDN